MLEILLVLVSVVAGIAVAMLFVREAQARATIAELKLAIHRKAAQVKELEREIADIHRIEEVKD
jgi:cell division protein FtsL